jgi:hypothetical protein
MTTDQKMIDKIAKLLRQAEDAESGQRPEEAIAFQDKALTLMADHGISEALARAHIDGLNITDEAKAASIYINFVGTYQQMQAELFGDLAEAMHCKIVIISQPRNRADIAARVYGMADHLSRLQTMWTLLAPQAQRGMSNAHPGPRASAAEVSAFRRSWLDGFTQEISSRIRNAEDAAAAAAGELVLYKTDKQRADEAMHTDYPNLSDYITSREPDWAGYDQGNAAGSSAQLHRSVTE